MRLEASFPRRGFAVFRQTEWGHCVILMNRFTVAIQYPGIGPQHPPRLQAIVDNCPYGVSRVVAMEMYGRDSDYEWDPVEVNGVGYERHTVMAGSSAEGRQSGRCLKQAVWGSLDEINPDVLVVNGWGHRESQHSLAWARRHNCATVLLSDSVEGNMKRVWWKEFYKKFLVRNCQSAFVAGTPQARYVAQLGIPEAKIFQPGSCSVDNDYWKVASARARADENHLRKEYDLPEKYFLCVSRFIECKNLPFLLDAYARYCEGAAEPWGLVLCGSGALEMRLRHQAEQLQLQSIRFVGFRQVGDLPIYYGLASAFVLASSAVECWGLVVNEAMACGLPVLVSHQVGSAEDLVVNEVTGFQFDPHSVTDLSQKMQLLTEDDELVARMGENAQQMIDTHSCDVAAQNLWSAVAVARAA